MIHLNNPEHLPPVACPLMVELPSGDLVKAERTGFISNRSQALEYQFETGHKAITRLRWTYP